MDLASITLTWAAISVGAPVVIYGSSKLSRKLLSSRTAGRRFDDIKD